MDGRFARSQPGYAGSDGTFARFETPAHGRRAMVALLGNNGYSRVARQNGLLGVMSRYAPSGHGNNDPRAYARAVAREMGINPTAPLDMSNRALRERMATAMERVETGGATTRNRWFGR